MSLAIDTVNVQRKEVYKEKGKRGGKSLNLLTVQ